MNETLEAIADLSRKFSKEIGSLKSELTKTSERVNDLSSRFTSIEKDIGDLSEDVKKLKSNTSEKFSELDKKIGKLDTDIENNNTSMKSMREEIRHIKANNNDTANTPWEQELRGLGIASFGGLETKLSSTSNFY
jgi:chromosome segregation ATPase